MPIQVIDRIEPQGGDLATFKLAYARHIGLTYPKYDDSKLAGINDVDTAIQKIDEFISDTTLNLEILNISKVEGSDKIPQINMGVGNIILSNYASAFGYQNIAGMKAFPILRYEPDFDNNTARMAIFVGKVGDDESITNAAIESLNSLIGEKYSSRMGGNWLNSGKITDVGNDKAILNNEYVVYINVTGIEPETSIKPITSDTVTSETGYYLFFVDKPEVGNISIGSYSMARGYQTWAGFWAFAEGYYGRAMGRYSHAEGTDTFSWYAAHAEGEGTRAFGHNAHSEGYRSVGSGVSSHAEGRQGLAYGVGSHKEGNSTTRIGVEKQHHDDDINSEIVLLSKSDMDNFDKLISLWSENQFSLAYGAASHVEGADTIGYGVYSHAEGYGTISQGQASHAEGSLYPIGNILRHTIAKGIGSHAEGQASEAVGSGSHAEGRGTVSKGEAAHAEGLYSKAYGDGSHAEGTSYPFDGVSEKTVAFDTGSHAEGQGTKAYGAGSHAEGRGSVANAEGSHVEGYRTTSDGEFAHAEGKGSAANGEASHAEGSATVNAGADYAHAEGSATVGENAECAHAEGQGANANAIGSHAEGSATVNIGANYAHAEGSSTAAGSYSHAEGYSKASGSYSHAEGYSNEADGYGAHAEGYDTKASGYGAHAEGYAYKDTTTDTTYIVTASGAGAHAEGQGTSANVSGAHAEGRRTVASAAGGHAEGIESKVYAAASHAEGRNTTVNSSGEGVHAEGYWTNANKTGAHAEGSRTTVDATGGHAEGYDTNVTGDYGHAEGYQAVVEAPHAHAEGQGTIASGENQHVQGKYNVKDPSLAHIVGAGTSGTRKNIHTLDWSGNAFYSGTLESPTIRRIDSAANSLNNKVDALIDTHNTHVNEINMIISQNNEDISKLKSSLTRFDRFAEFSEGLKYGGAFDELPTISVNNGNIKITGTLTTLQGTVTKDVNSSESLNDDDVTITNTVTADKVIENAKPGLIIVVKGTEYVLEIKPSNDAEIKVDNLEFIPLMNINDTFYNVEDEIDKYHPMELKSASHSGSGIILVGTPKVVVNSTIKVNKKCQHSGDEISGLTATVNGNLVESGFDKLEETASKTTNDTTYTTETIFYDKSSGSATGIFADTLYNDELYRTPPDIKLDTKQVTIFLKDRPGNTATTTISVTPVYPIYCGIFKENEIKSYTNFIYNDDLTYNDLKKNMYKQTSLNIGKITLSGQIASDDYISNTGEPTYFFYGIPTSILRGKSTVSIEWMGGMFEDIDIVIDPENNNITGGYNVDIAGVPYTFVRAEQVITDKTKTVQSVIIS